MNKKILFSLTTLLSISVTSSALAFGQGTGISLFTEAEVTLHSNPCTVDFPPPKAPVCADYNTFSTIWLDPGLILATGLDLAATMNQDKRVIDCQKALDKLEASVGKKSTGDGTDASDTSLSPEDSVVVAPSEVVEVLNVAPLDMKVHDKEDWFDSVRSAVENYVFYTDDCKDDCVLERQNTWLLTSVAMAAASGDKILASTKGTGGTGDKISNEFSELANNFNAQDQNSPMAMWGNSSRITLHTHVQQNDINALYARDLEMNGLKGVRDSEDARLLENDSRNK